MKVRECGDLRNDDVETRKIKYERVAIECSVKTIVAHFHPDPVVKEDIR